MSSGQNTGILMADLSGYSALTETHGAFSAANLIDRYIEIVNDSLVGDSKLTERVGDEVMIMSASADNLLSTAAMIIKNTAREDNFLRVHGGLHYGEVLTRNNSHFGSAINLTSRIAKKANPGTFWCSQEFIAALENKSLFTLTPIGRYRFKNIKEENELAELTGECQTSFFVDPVCHMLILNKEIAVKCPGVEEIYFCSTGCLGIYNSLKESEI
ncbi:MAG: adenylate/guanylate cyclase domain-containing protein [Chitinophagaceae bacterium]|nr:adenylate/guanylate cyclase domain-containing protein [Chitinophagaceae bacterium]